MPGPSRTSAWRRLRRAFRWCRIGLLFLLLALLVALLYVNQVGLPAFLKAPLRAGLQRQGVDFQFKRLAWHWYRGFVAEEAMLRSVADAAGPRAQAAEVALNLDWGRLLLTRRVRLESLQIRGGRLVLPLQEPGQPPDECSLDGIGAALRFQPGDAWELQALEAAFLGATFQASGTITNAPALAAWSRALATKGRPAQPAPWRAPLREFVDVWKRLRFAEPPDFRLRFRGDGRQIESFVGELRAQTGGAETPWGSLRDLRAVAELNQPPRTSGGLQAALRLNVADARSPWGELRQAALTARGTFSTTNPAPAQVDWELATQQAQAFQVGVTTARLTGRSDRLAEDGRAWRTSLTLAAGGVTTAWGHAHTNRCTATFEHSLTNLIPAVIHLTADLEALDTRWGGAEVVRLDTRLQPVSHPVSKLDPAWGGWAKLAPFAVSWQLLATNLQSPQLALDQFTVIGDWQAPRLTITNLQARLYGGSLNVPVVHLDVGTRAIDARFVSDFDAHAVAPLLGQGAAEWLAQFAWSRPPRAEASVRAVLPAWTNREPHWARGVLPSVVVEAQVRGADAAYRAVPIQQAQLSIGLSNQVLRLRDFHVVRPEGDADLAYDLNTASQEFRWRLRANLDPKGVGPAIDRDAPRLLSLFEFGGPAAVTGEVWGRWGPDKEINLALSGVATNFSFRGERIDELRTDVRMARQFLAATNVSLRTGAEWIQAAGVGVDFVDPWVYLTNAEAEVDPLRFARVIGSNLVHTLSPYRFDRPPRVRAEGRVPIQGAVDEADMRFQVAGGSFHFWRFNVPDLDGQVHWEGDRVTITNVVCGFYEGQLRGHLRADIQPDGSADLAFRANVTNVNLQRLVWDTIPTTNRIEGTLQGTLDVTRANSADWKSWNGSGRFYMRDGLLWNVPIISVLSPMLNAVVPGLGNNRARAATGSVTITNSLMRTDDLEIVAPPARLLYRGTLDFDWNVRAQVEAEILPGTPLIGPILNIVFAPVTKALSFKIRGTLGKPELEPLLVPKFLLPMFRPFQTIRGLFSTPSSAPTTNSPAKGKP